ncbi:hypothetical protein [Bacteroides fragilis]|jgi:hypothetical protein|uniref:Uncharacterized protein n=1 Tax=Bacteroides fragilis TaxID=817 RepID=A0A0I9S9D6_BACFG|nr:hypothetical protein [Bacteroides fragilis]DAZ13144.1 MAG TPA: hypothetical protein [Caudoviricetes sp.]MCE8567173.1 hypothetical protein [Bacteroides fragilis]MCM0197281.1 hypothetical protein [Bacteroides fragilis]MCM0198134.1 hypothetical protein [Bacteroides fragilis]MCM0208485.1 hypothetical protein [Bacteroides fragilis]
MKVQFNEIAYEAQSTKNIALDDIVCLNGITGYVDAILDEFIVLIDEANRSHRIAIRSIESAFMLHRFREVNHASIEL